MIKDDRTPEQKVTHYIGVVGTDKFMSGWGMAEGGMSYAVWACRPEDFAKVFYEIQGRSDMGRVRQVDLRTYHPKATHTHIYVREYA